MNQFAALSDWILLGSAIYHFVMGLACLLNQDWIRWLMLKTYRIQLPVMTDPTLQFSVKPLGAFAVWTGAVCFIAWLHPGDWSPGIKFSLAGLFALRALFRVLYRDHFSQVFQTSWKRSRMNVLLNLLLSGVLIAGGLWR
jgi:hypothetical protein